MQIDISDDDYADLVTAKATIVGTYPTEAALLQSAVLDAYDTARLAWATEVAARIQPTIDALEDYGAAVGGDAATETATLATQFVTAKTALGIS